jgi:hypothetical protein
MKAKWLMIGGAAVAVAVVGGIVAVFLVGRPGDPPAAGPDGGDVQANQVPAGGGKSPATFWLEDRLPSRTFEYAYKDVGSGGGKETKFTREVYAGRRDTPRGLVYFVGMNTSDFDFRMTTDDAATLADFLENPTGGLPAGLSAPPKGVARRTLEVEDCFRANHRLAFSYNATTKQFDLKEEWYQGVNTAFGTYPNGNSFQTVYQPKPFAELLRGALKDVETLKSYPAKR